MVRKKGPAAFLKRHRKDVDTPYLAGGVTIGVFSIVSIVLFGASWLQTLLLSSNNFAAVVSAVLIDLTNADRASAGAQALVVNDRLTAAAQAKANDMAARGYFSHKDPDGREPWTWLKEAGYDYRYAGENLAIQFSDSIEVERAWLASPSHRANLLNDQFSEIGIATAYGAYQGQPTTFVVQMFAEPRMAATPLRHAGHDKSDLSWPAAGDGEQVTSYMESSESSEDSVPRTILTAPDASESAVLGIASALTNDTAEFPETAFTAGNEADFIEHVAASPQSYLGYAYTILAALILVIGGRVWWFEWSQRHFRHSAYAILLSIALLIFLYAADAYIFTKPIIADSVITATV